jgi:hypothetical protein
MHRQYESTSALECAEHQAARITELESAVDASHVALRTLLTRLTGIRHGFTHYDKGAAVRALTGLCDELAEALDETIADAA